MAQNEDAFSSQPAKYIVGHAKELTGLKYLCVYRFSCKKSFRDVPYNPVIPLLGEFLDSMSYSRDTCSAMFIAAPLSERGRGTNLAVHQHKTVQWKCGTYTLSASQAVGCTHLLSAKPALAWSLLQQRKTKTIGVLKQHKSIHPWRPEITPVKNWSNPPRVTWNPHNALNGQKSDRPTWGTIGPKRVVSCTGFTGCPTKAGLQSTGGWHQTQGHPEELLC